MTKTKEDQISRIIAANVQSVCDWDDRTSPDDYPEHLLITPAELSELLEGVVDAALSVQPAEAVVGEPVAWTGSGSMMAIADGREGFIWPTKADAHPIPLYAAPSAPDGWQPIETAPKDGTRVLIHCDLASGFNVQEASYVGGYDSGDVWLTAVGCVYSVKYWRPLPAPPALGGKP